MFETTLQVGSRVRFNANYRQLGENLGVPEQNRGAHYVPYIEMTGEIVERVAESPVVPIFLVKWPDGEVFHYPWNALEEANG